MSKRLQIPMPDDEFDGIRTLPEQHRATISEPGARIAAVRRAAGNRFPAPDIDEMLREIEAGYGTPLE